LINQPHGWEVNEVNVKKKDSKEPKIETEIGTEVDIGGEADTEIDTNIQIVFECESKNASEVRWEVQVTDFMIFQQPEKKRHHSKFNIDEEERETKREKTDRETESQKMCITEAEKKKPQKEPRIGPEVVEDTDADIKIVQRSEVRREGQLSDFKALRFYDNNITQIYWDVVRAIVD